MEMTRRKGFTLIELLVVITIIGILMTLITVSIASVQRKSRDSRRKADISLIRGSLDLFKSDFKIYPNFTFYLGDNLNDSGQPIDGGAMNSAFDLAPSIGQCTALPNGSPVLFASNTDNLDTATLLEGFDSVNAFLICLKYAESQVRDPSLAAEIPDNYQYRVSADYADMIVSAKLESANDPSLESLFNINTDNMRFIEGSGKTSRQLADDSNTTRFFALPTGNLNDGLYLYQCLKSASGADITKDNRSSSSYQPIIFNSSTGWEKNTSCQNNATGLHVVQSYGRKPASTGSGSF